MSAAAALALLGLTVGSPTVRVLDAQGPGEYEVTAAFLYNFVRFVQWPEQDFPDANTPVGVCILGPDPFGDVLDQSVSGKNVNGRGVKVRRLRQIGESSGCHLLFVSQSERDRLARIVEVLGDRSVLTVGDSQGFAEAGCIISLVLEHSKVRFEINVRAAQRARLVISSRLLSLARIVEPGAHTGDQP